MRSWTLIAYLLSSSVGVREQENYGRELLQDMVAINGNLVEQDGRTQDPNDPKVYNDALGAIKLNDGQTLLSVLAEKGELWGEATTVQQPEGHSGRLQFVLAGLCPLSVGISTICGGPDVLAFTAGETGAFYQKGNLAPKLGSSMRTIFTEQDREMKLESEPDLDVYLVYITGKATGGGMLSGWTALHGWIFLTDRTKTQFFKKRFFAHVQTIPFGTLETYDEDLSQLASPWPTSDDIAIPEKEKDSKFSYKFW